jgi:hypothetical protein
MSMRARSVAVLLVAGVTGLGFASLGCADSLQQAKSARAKRAKAAVNPFPSRDSLAKLAELPVAAAPARPVASAAEWNVEIVPSDVAPPPVEKRFAQVATASSSELSYTKELRCVARELGRFQAEHGAAPDERLKRFMVAACGVTNPAVGTMAQEGDAPPEITDEHLLAEWQKKLTIPAALKGTAVGVWMARTKKKVVIMTAFAKPQADVVVSEADAAGLVMVRGVAPANTELVLGLVNQGEHGVARCEADPATPLPLFAFRCAMAPADKTAWVEVAVRAQGRLLVRSYGLALARRDVAAPLQFTATPRAPKPVTSPGDLRVALLEGVNQARAAGKLAPLELAATQTATNERLAPHFFDASFKSDQQTGDTVGLGLMAGWDVEGTIKSGNLFSALLSGTSDANQWLDYALEMPMGRFTMLEAGARKIAIGVPPQGSVGGLGAVVTTYEMFVGNDHRADTARVFAQLTKARAARRLPAPAAMKGVVKDLARQASLVNAGKRDTEDALDAALVAVRDRSNQSVRGWVLTTNDLSLIELPPEVLAAGPLEVGIEVTHHKPEGAAWGSYVVFLVMPAGAGAPSDAPTPQIQAAGPRSIVRY